MRTIKFLRSIFLLNLERKRKTFEQRIIGITCRRRGTFCFSLNREKKREREEKRVESKKTKKKKKKGERECWQAHPCTTPEILNIKRSSSGLKISYLIRVIGLDSLGFRHDFANTSFLFSSSASYRAPPTTTTKRNGSSTFTGTCLPLCAINTGYASKKYRRNMAFYRTGWISFGAKRSRSFTTLECSRRC